MSELSRRRGSEGYGACGDADAPGFVTDKLLEELNIKVTAREEE